jgi:3-deoxy-D-manno-octulosonic-acid transferase
MENRLPGDVPLMLGNRLQFKPSVKSKGTLSAGTGYYWQLLYNILLTWGLIVTLPISLPLTLTSAKRRATIRQRLGLIPIGPGQDRSQPEMSRRVWVHALSVGEVLSAIPMVKSWRHGFKAEALVFSASTLTGYKVAQRELGHVVDALFYYPYDLIFSVKRITRQVTPDLVILVETDIWPNFLFEMQRRNVPVMLVNAKLSERSWRGYKRLGGLIRPLFGMLTLVCTQTTKDAERFERLGIRPERLHITGNIKFDQTPPPAERVEALRQRLNLRPDQETIVAGSTHPGEERLIESAWGDLRKQRPGVKLIVVPRDPARAAEVRRFLSRAGHDAILLSEVAHPDRERCFDILVVDTIGILSRLYALANIAIVGGSLVPNGGHNPLEPAAWSKPIVFGSDMSDFGQVARMLLDGDGAIQVDDQPSLSKVLATLFEDRQRAAVLGANAYQVYKQNQGTVAKTIDVISTFCATKK